VSKQASNPADASIEPTEPTPGTILVPILYSIAEPASATICACLPAYHPLLLPLFRKVLNARFTSSPKTRHTRTRTLSRPRPLTLALGSEMACMPATPRLLSHTNTSRTSAAMLAQPSTNVSPRTSYAERWPSISSPVPSSSEVLAYSFIDDPVDLAMMPKALSPIQARFGDRAGREMVTRAREGRGFYAARGHLDLNAFPMNENFSPV
jgi:hypothetical protein